MWFGWSLVYEDVRGMVRASWNIAAQHSKGNQPVLDTQLPPN